MVLSVLFRTARTAPQRSIKGKRHENGLPKLVMNLNVKLGLASSLDKLGLLASFRRFYASKGGLVLTFHRVLKTADAASCYEPHLITSDSVFERLLMLLRSEF